VCTALGSLSSCWLCASSCSPCVCAL
jgi:hypothetical protein